MITTTTKIKTTSRICTNKAHKVQRIKVNKIGLNKNKKITSCICISYKAQIKKNMLGSLFRPRPKIRDNNNQNNINIREKISGNWFPDSPVVATGASTRQRATAITRGRAMLPAFLSPPLLPHCRDFLCLLELGAAVPDLRIVQAYRQDLVSCDVTPKRRGFPPRVHAFFIRTIL